jgi:hypothetical protein
VLSRFPTGKKLFSFAQFFFLPKKMPRGETFVAQVSGRISAEVPGFAKARSLLVAAVLREWIVGIFCAEDCPVSAISHRDEEKR